MRRWVRRREFLYIPKGVMNVMAEMGGWLHLPLNPFRMQKLTENYVVSNAKIKRLWGYKRCRYPQKRIGLYYS